MPNDDGSGHADSFEEKDGLSDDSEYFGRLTVDENNDDADEEKSAMKDFSTAASEEVSGRASSHTTLSAGRGERWNAAYEDADTDYDQFDIATNHDNNDVSSSILSTQDEQRLLGAFLLAADGGLEEDHSGENAGEDGEEPHLPTDGPTCLKKFTTVAASLGLKITRDQLREDFEKVVHSNGLVNTDGNRLWRGAYDPNGVVRGFTYTVFKRYYLAKIQGELRERDIRQAWDDLHYGTGRKRMQGPAGEQCAEQPYIMRAELQKILTREGEALTDEEIDELLRECRPDDKGRIVYEGYRRMLMDPSL